MHLKNSIMREILSNLRLKVREKLCGLIKPYIQEGFLVIKRLDKDNYRLKMEISYYKDFGKRENQ